MKSKKQGIKQYTTKRKIFTFLAILLPIIIIFLCSIFKSFFTDTMETLEVAYYISQVLATIFLIAGTVIAVWQYYITSKDSTRQLQLEQVQRAIDLSEYYKNNILDNYRAISYIYERSGIQDIMQNIRACDMHRFDEKELHNLLTEKQIENLKKIQFSDKFNKAVIDANIIYKLGLHIETKIVEDENEKKYYK